MSNETVDVSIKTALNNLEAIAKKIRTDASFCEDMVEELKDRGYGWFGDISESDEKQLKAQVMKVFAVAVNEAIQEKVEPVNSKNTMLLNDELHHLLGIGEKKSLNHYFSPVFSDSSSPDSRPLMTSPLDLAKYLKTTAPQWLVKNMIQYQFDIRWRTHTGEPDDYTYYDFCDTKKNTTRLLKYIPRLAHVKATLYKKCRRANVHHLRSITKEKLCPTVYIRTPSGWKSWKADEDEFKDVGNINTRLSWINSSILEYITENADEQKPDLESLKHSLTKPTLYWAVLEDRDFKSGSNLKLKPIGKTQVYVGKTNNGIKGRWTKDSDNHCQMMKKCLDNVCAMTTYDPLRLEGIQLVDARLALAKVREEETALFVIETFGDDVDKAEIAVQKAQLRSEDSIGRDEEVNERVEELDAAKAVLEELKKGSKTSNSDAAKVLLSEAEKWHRNGKRADKPRENVIPYGDYKMTWKPTDMGYGMNSS